MRSIQCLAFWIHPGESTLSLSILSSFIWHLSNFYLLTELFRPVHVVQIIGTLENTVVNVTRSFSSFPRCTCSTIFLFHSSPPLAAALYWNFLPSSSHHCCVALYYYNVIYDPDPLLILSV